MHVVGRLGSAPFRFRCSGRLAFSLSLSVSLSTQGNPGFRFSGGIHAQPSERRHVSDPWIRGSSVRPALSFDIPSPPPLPPRSIHAPSDSFSFFLLQFILARIDYSIFQFPGRVTPTNFLPKFSSTLLSPLPLDLPISSILSLFLLSFRTTNKILSSSTRENSWRRLRF